MRHRNSRAPLNSTKHKHESSYMKKLIIASIMLASVLAVSADDSQPQSKARPITRTEAALTTATATVQSIDYDKREVTLKGPLGNEVTFTVDPQVKRLNEIKVGDVVRADYYVSLVAELRKPTSEEEKNPIAVVEDSGKAPARESPGAGQMRRVKVVTTIEGIDRPTRTITIKGPRGNYLTARVEDPSNLEKVRIGENIVVTYTEALAISLEKVNRDH
jgi:Cu/Ag efflux protein CusF